jgi:hypothetical protein
MVARVLLSALAGSVGLATACSQPAEPPGIASKTGGGARDVMPNGPMQAEAAVGNDAADSSADAGAEASVPSSERAPGSAPDASDAHAPSLSQPTGGDGPSTTWPCAGGGCPDEVAPGHLQLWLRSDQGVECAQEAGINRVRVWRDLSGNGRDAVPAASKVGPVCGAGMLNGRHAITFPRTDGLEDQEYLETNLASLKDKGFTIAVVEKREGAANNLFMIGSQLEFPDAVSCPMNPNANRGLLLGYWMPGLLGASTWGTTCDVSATVPAAFATASLVVTTYEPMVGLKLFLNGNKVGESPSSGLEAIGRGLVGRAFQHNMYSKDTRYRGQMAEVVVFDVPLEDGTRTALEQYLKATWGTGP